MANKIKRTNTEKIMDTITTIIRTICILIIIGYMGLAVYATCKGATDCVPDSITEWGI